MFTERVKRKQSAIEIMSVFLKIIQYQWSRKYPVSEQTCINPTRMAKRLKSMSTAVNRPV